MVGIVRVIANGNFEVITTIIEKFNLMFKDYEKVTIIITKVGL